MFGAFPVRALATQGLLGWCWGCCGPRKGPSKPPRDRTPDKQSAEQNPCEEQLSPPSLSKPRKSQEADARTPLLTKSRSGENYSENKTPRDSVVSHSAFPSSKMKYNNEFKMYGAPKISRSKSAEESFGKKKNQKEKKQSAFPISNGRMNSISESDVSDISRSKSKDENHKRNKYTPERREVVQHSTPVSTSVDQQLYISKTVVCRPRSDDEEEDEVRPEDKPSVPKVEISTAYLDQEGGKRICPQDHPSAPSGSFSSLGEDVSITEDLPVTLPSHSKSASPSPIVGAAGRKGPGSVSSGEWPPSSPDEDIDRLVAIHQQRSSLSSLGKTICKKSLLTTGENTNATENEATMEIDPDEFNSDSAFRGDIGTYIAKPPRSDSLASVYSGAEGRYGTVAVKGEVEFGLEYNYKASCLEIHVKQCRDLAPVDTKRNRSDPYVKVYLLPDKSKSGKRKTKVKKHTLNPVFDETLKFQMTLHGLETRTLWLTVWHSDMFGRNDFLGEVMMGLENKVFDDPSPHWYPLQERTEPFDDLLSYKGDLIIGLKFVPPDVTTAVQKKGKRSSRGSLHVLVKEAKNLTAIKANGTSDPFCKSYLLPDKGRSSKQKTPVLRRTCNPVWNYTFVYEDVSLQDLSERSLELTVWDHDRLASNEFLGGLRFNLGTGKHFGKTVDWMDATGKELTLWQHMLERPNFWVEGCLTLRPSLDQRHSS